MKELKYISRYVKRHGLQYILGIAALFAVDLMNVYIPRYTGEITDGLEAQTLDMDGVLGLIREFDSSIIKKTFAGRINPVLFLSNFSFLYMLFYVIV